MAVITERDEEIYHLYAAKGLSKTAIAKQLNIDRKSIQKHIAKVEREGLRHLGETVEMMKYRQTEQLVFIYHEAVEGWERSCGDKIKRTHAWKSTTMGDGGDEDKQDIVVEAQAGDPRFLVAAMGAIQALREMWGIDAPVDMNLNLNLPAHANAKLARARAEAARIIGDQLLSPAEQAIRRIGTGGGPVIDAQVVNGQNNPNPDTGAGPDT
jgi:predicted DNA-binding protein YlxM (UPF0122 family)